MKEMQKTKIQIGDLVRYKNNEILPNITDERSPTGIVVSVELSADPKISDHFKVYWFCNLPKSSGWNHGISYLEYEGGASLQLLQKVELK